MFNTFQSAYTKFQSTESALPVIHDHLTKAMDRQQVTGLNLLYLSAASTQSTTPSYSIASLPGLAYATVLSLGSSHIYPTRPFLSPAVLGQIKSRFDLNRDLGNKKIRFHLLEIRFDM